MNKLFQTLLYAGIVASLFSCSEEVATPISLQSNQMSQCKTNTTLAPSMNRLSAWVAEEGEYFKYEATANGGLTLTHVNAIYNCAADSATTTVVSDGSNISIKEVFHSQSEANCVCPYDVTTKLQGFSNGTYTLTITTAYGEVHKLTFKYSPTLSGKQMIEHK